MQCRKLDTNHKGMATNQPEMNSKGTGFLHLPPELRLQIYLDPNCTLLMLLHLSLTCPTVRNEINHTPEVTFRIQNLRGFDTAYYKEQRELQPANDIVVALSIRHITHVKEKAEADLINRDQPCVPSDWDQFAWNVYLKRSSSMDLDMAFGEVEGEGLMGRPGKKVEDNAVLENRARYSTGIRSWDGVWALAKD
ncbi:hypothetical protein BJ508DRAFT_309300 [Ascobolus immersus RN42]|uniref:F-box domain-containing protein n=1 Tax=Ascobolus immersus RN42 TaxID=1160509 RepID=A0A3N4HZ26_ASCIM|nr:hypothetical protein BJ508DRAFT_309300 [Ascobolus immersus RN42]